MTLRLTIIALRLCEYAEAVLAAGHAAVVAESREYLERGSIAALGLVMLAAHLINGTQFVHPVGPVGRAAGQHVQRRLDQLGLTAKVTPGMQLGADRVRDRARLRSVARSEQVVPGL
jgi:hypothetical protein